MMPIDKKAHFFAGAAIAATVALYTGPLYGLAAGIAAGISKEIYDRAGYGTLIHSALEGFGKAKGATSITDETQIQDALSGALDEHFKKSFGSDPEPGLALQRETARERLLAFAALPENLTQVGCQTIVC
jgi:hypothetical protein